MKFELFNEETNKVWKQVSGGPALNRLQFEHDLYKKLLNFFQVGDYYYLIFNFNILNLEFVSPSIEKVLGYSPSEFNIPFFLEIVHPEDRPILLDFETRASAFLMNLPLEKLMKYKVRYDFRLRRKDGGYIRVLHQSTVVEHDNDGRITRTLSVQNDIGYLKTDGTSVLSFIGLDGEPSYTDVGAEKIYLANKEILTPREKQVIMLLIEGKLSKEIAALLNISKQTVDKHRKNMLRKNNISTTAELIGKAINHGWI